MAGTFVDWAGGERQRAKLEAELRRVLAEEDMLTVGGGTWPKPPGPSAQRMRP